MYRIRTIFTGVAGSPWYTNHYFDDSQSTPASSQSAVLGFWGGLVGYIRDDVTVTVSGEVPTVSVATGQITAMAGIPDQNFAGSSTAEPLPPTTQGLVTWLTGAYAGGRSVRGRTFVPGLTDICNADGVPNQFFLDAIGNAAEAFISYSDSTPVIYSPTNNLEAPIVGHREWSQFAVQRSRRD